MTADNAPLRIWYARRPFGKLSLETSIQLQMQLRAHEEGLSLEAFREELARRNGSGNTYLVGNRAYGARPSRWL